MSSQASHQPTVARWVSSALRTLPHLTRISRHAWSLVRHSTPRKVLNLLRVEMEYRLRRTVVKGRPYILIVDPINVCNLRCPLCPTGLGTQGRRGQLMSWETYTRIIDQMAPWAYEVNLYNWGESILHPHVFEMIEYARSRNLATNMSANFNKLRDGAIDRLILSGLENLSLSIDGATQETYARYRVGGDLEQVLENARHLVRRKKELRRRTPSIEWQYIVFRHNAHEVEAARRLAREIGVDRFRLIPPGMPFDTPDPDAVRKEWFLEGQRDESRGPLQSACFYLYRAFTANPDGGAAPCCIAIGKEHDFGNVLDEDFDRIWNNEKYRSARALYRKGGDPSTQTICDRCTIFRKRSAARAVQSSVVRGGE